MGVIGFGTFVSMATNFWVIRNVGEFVTGCMAVWLLRGLTTGKGKDKSVRCFLCNAGQYRSHAVFWRAGSLRQEFFATGNAQL